MYDNFDAVVDEAMEVGDKAEEVGGEAGQSIGCGFGSTRRAHWQWSIVRTWCHHWEYCCQIVTSPKLDSLLFPPTFDSFCPKCFIPKTLGTLFVDCESFKDFTFLYCCLADFETIWQSCLT